MFQDFAFANIIYAWWVAAVLEVCLRQEQKYFVLLLNCENQPSDFWDTSWIIFWASHAFSDPIVEVLGQNNIAKSYLQRAMQLGCILHSWQSVVRTHFMTVVVEHDISSSPQQPGITMPLLLKIGCNFTTLRAIGPSQEIWIGQCLTGLASKPTVYPKKYAHGFVVLCFVVVMQSFIMNSHEVFIHIHQGCFAGTGAIVRLPQCQWSKPDGYGKISQCITTTKHSKAKTVCIFLWIYCITLWEGQKITSPIIRNWTSSHKEEKHSSVVFRILNLQRGAENTALLQNRSDSEWQILNPMTYSNYIFHRLQVPDIKTSRCFVRRHFNARSD